MLPRAFLYFISCCMLTRNNSLPEKQPKGVISCLPHLPGACGGLGGDGAGAARLLVSSAGG